MKYWFCICFLLPLLLAADEAFDKWLDAQKTIIGNLEKIVRETKSEDAAADLDYLRKKIAQEIQAEASRPEVAALPVFHVVEHGVPDDGVSDAAPAVQALVERVKNLPGGARIVFPAGNYHFRELTRNAHLFISNARNLRIEGAPDTKFIFENPQKNGIFISDSENVDLESLTITYDPLPYTFGSITSVDAEGFAFRPAPGAENPELPHFGNCSYKGLVRFVSGETVPNTVIPLRYNPAPFLFASGPARRQEDGSFRFTLAGADQRYAVGWKLVFYARQYSSHAVQFDRTKRCRVHRVTLHASPGIGFLAIASAGLFVTDCRIEPVPGSGSFNSTNADAMFIRDASLGGLIAGNHFAMMGDDYLNVHDIVLVAGRIEGNTIVAPKNSWRGSDLVVGARIGWIRASRNETGVEDWAVITAVESDGDSFRIQLDRPLPAEFVTQENRRPEHKRFDVFTLAANHAHGLAVLDNEFLDGSSRIVLGGRNVLFAGNRIVDRKNYGSLFHLGVEGDWWADGLREGRPSRNLLIENNDISTLGKNVFHLDARLPRPGTGFQPEFCSYSDWKIRNNRITLREAMFEPVAPFKLTGTRNLEISGNRIDVRCPVSEPVFQLNECQNVELEDNIITRQPEAQADEAAALILPPERWRVQNHLAAADRSGGRIEAVFSGRDPFIGTALPGLACAEYPLALFRLKVAPGAAETAQLFWQPTGTSLYRVLTFPIHADGEFHDYRISLDRSPFWSGSIGFLRLDPTTDPKDAAGFALENFRLAPRLALP